jgi:hypothetical protein
MQRFRLRTDILPLPHTYCHVLGRDYRRGLDWRTDSLTIYTRKSELQALIKLLLIYTLYKSLVPAKPSHSFISRSLVMDLNNGDSSASVVIPFFFCSETLGTEATTGLLYQPRMIGDGDCGEIGGMKIGRGNLRTRRKPALAPFCPRPPQIPHD